MLHFPRSIFGPLLQEVQYKKDLVMGTLLAGFLKMEKVILFPDFCRKDQSNFVGTAYSYVLWQTEQLRPIPNAAPFMPRT